MKNMKKRILEFKKNFEFKKLNNDIIINDNKQTSKPFGDRYILFLLVNKGAKINTKDDLIYLLNKKPRSFLSRLQGLVRSFSRVRNKFINKSNKQHPKQFILNNKIKPVINTTKTYSFIPTNNNNNNIIKTKEIKDKLLKLVKAKKKIGAIINNKMNKYTELLNNNKLRIPIHLMNPLLKNNAPKIIGHNLYTIDLKKLVQNNNKKLELINKKNNNVINNKNINLNKEVFNLNNNNNINLGIQLSTVIKQLFYPDLINGSKKWILKAGWDRWWNYDKMGMTTVYTKKINYLKDLLTQYYEHNPNKITLTRYFQLITPYKYVQPFHQNIQYYFNKYNNKQKEQIVNLLQYAFRAMSCLISKPVFMENNDYIIINLFYFFIPGKVKKYKRFNRFNRRRFKNKTIPIVTSLNGIIIKNKTRAKSKLTKLQKLKLKIKAKQKPFKQLNKFITKINKNKLNKLCTILSKIFNKPVKLDLIPLTLPFFDDQILVKAFAILSKKLPVRTIFNFIYRNTKLYSKIKANYRYRYHVTRSFLAGIKIKIGGRLMTQRVIPKKSARVIQRGPTAVGKVTFVDWSRINLKNKRGAHSITIKMSHVM